MTIDYRTTSGRVFQPPSMQRVSILAYKGYVLEGKLDIRGCCADANRWFVYLLPFQKANDDPCKWNKKQKGYERTNHGKSGKLKSLLHTGQHLKTIGGHRNGVLDSNTSKGWIIKSGFNRNHVPFF